jgi:hypothetical protein
MDVGAKAKAQLAIGSTGRGSEGKKNRESRILTGGMQATFQRTVVTTGHFSFASTCEENDGRKSRKR